jgi:branched-chain amino acid transport system substrate-binding protein
MKRFFAHWIAAIVVTLGTASLVHAEILIGMPGPLTGRLAWFGEQMQEGIGMKVAELNAAGGVLGQQIALLPVDDYCDPEQAVAAARKLVEAQVDAVIGHLCSGAAIPASRIYEDAGILFFGSSATNPKLTDQGFRTVFRIAGRDTRQGVMAADYLAKRWSDHNIAIVHDGGAYGVGVAEAARRRLSELGVRKVTFQAIEPGQTDYFDLIDQLQAKNADILFFGGYYAEAGLIIRQARSHGYGIRMIGPDTLNTEFFWRVAGEASEGVLFPSNPELRDKREAAPLVAKFRAKGYEPEGITLQTYTAMQVWAEAVEKAGTLELNAVIQSLRTNQFDTLFGTIRFDAKGDATGYEPFEWYIWKGGQYAPVNPAELIE